MKSETSATPSASRKARQQQVGVRQIELLARGAREERRDLESPAALHVDEGREDTRRVEVGQTEEVDRAVQAHEGGAVEVADDAVFADGVVAACHRWTSLTPRATGSSPGSDTSDESTKISVTGKS